METPQRSAEAQLPSEAGLVQTLTELATRHNHASQYTRSMQVASAALTLDSNAALAYFYRGMAADGLGNRVQAMEDLRHAARLGAMQAHDVLRSWGVD